MNALQQEHFTILGRAPFTLGEFSLASYKARESAGAAAGPAAGRVVLLRQLAATSGAASALAAASQVYASLAADPHILRHYGLVTIGEDPSGSTGLAPGIYAVSEWAQGLTLAERIRRVAPFSLAATLKTAIEVAQGVLKAESVGVAHGHLTADEIFITSDGEAKVADFLLGEVAARADATVPPPAAQLESLSAFGVLIYEMLTGQPAVEADLPLSPQRLERNVPNALDGITQKASLGSVAGGYSNLSELLADLITAREQLRLEQPLDWTPFNQQAAGNIPKPLNSKTRPAFKPLNPAAAAASTAPITSSAPVSDEPPSVDHSSVMPKSPYSTEPNAGPSSQPIPPASVEKPADAGTGSGDEYGDYEPPSSRGSAVLRAIGIVLGSIAIIAIVFACVYFALLVSNVPSDITVPSLIGKQFTDAKTTAAQQHFSLDEIGHSNSDTWPVGAIYQQTPAAGRMIKSGKEVDVFVSDGPRLIDVPDLSQTTQEKAQAVLQDAGLPLGSVQLVYDNIVPKGIVTAQEPVAGSKVARDQAINLTVSKGPPPPTAPTNLSATCTIQGEVDLSWDQVPIASAYDIYRDGKKIQSGFPETEYSDVGLDPTQTYVYTVTAVDSNGESPASTPASSAAQPGNAVAAPDGAATTTPDDATSDQSDNPEATPQPAATTSLGAPKQRQFEVKFRVPRGTAYTRNVQIQVQDATGTNIAYNQDLSRGSIVDQQVQGFGNRIILRIFIDGKLVKQQTK